LIGVILILNNDPLTSHYAQQIFLLNDIGTGLDEKGNPFEASGKSYGNNTIAIRKRGDGVSPRILRIMRHEIMHNYDQLAPGVWHSEHYSAFAPGRNSISTYGTKNSRERIAEIYPAFMQACYAILSAAPFNLFWDCSKQMCQSIFSDVDRDLFLQCMATRNLILHHDPPVGLAREVALRRTKPFSRQEERHIKAFARRIVNTAFRYHARNPKPAK